MTDSIKYLNELKKNDFTKDVWEIFYNISQIPRKSGTEQKVIQMIEDFSKSNGLETRKDSAGNLLIISKSNNSNEWLALQGHVDMVCVKSNDSKHDFTKDSIEWIIDKDYLKADGTTLGSDNGMGVAMCLALAVNKDIKRPNLEIILTVDEEIGMSGANNVGFELKSKRMLNLDTEEEGILYTGCAGGCRIELDKLYFYRDDNSNAYELDLYGLPGGHSGVNIHENFRYNALQVSLSILKTIKGVRLIDIQSGDASNSIPKSAKIIFTTSYEIKDIRNLFEKEQEYYKYKFTINQINSPISLSSIDSENIINFILSIPQGVIEVSNQIPGLIQTSNNLGIAKMDSYKNSVIRYARLNFVLMPRSSNDKSLKMFIDKIHSLSSIGMYNISIKDSYPGWQPDSDSKLLEICKDVYKSLYNIEPKVTAIHAGLECGILKGKYPNIDFISFGPSILEAHTVNERIEISSVQKTYKYLQEIVKKLA